MLTAIRIPNTFAGKAHYFEKVRDRQVWDFALVNIAASFGMSGSSIGDARMVVNGVSATPYRFTAVEAFLRGKSRDKATADQAADMAVEGPRRAAQRLQDSTHESAREARHPWEKGQWTS